MRPKDDPVIAEIRETRHKISEEFSHDPQKLIAYYIELQRKQAALRERLSQDEGEELLETVNS